MTVVVLGIDALDPDLVDEADHPHLTLDAHSDIDTIVSATGEPSTHELWPTIITGLRPEEHGLQLDDGITWEHPILNVGSSIAAVVLPDSIRTQIGAWLLNKTEQDTFRVSADYYEKNGISTVFDGRDAVAIGIPNYVTDPESEDREHQLRRRLGDLFERDPDHRSGHRSSDPDSFYELCMEMAMIRIARVRRALRGRRYELVFGYTSGLDLIGHVSYDRPKLQHQAYRELNEFVGELKADLAEDDELVLVSDHGLQDGLHTDSAMLAATDRSIVSRVERVTDVRSAIDATLSGGDHVPKDRDLDSPLSEKSGEEIKEHLEELGYL